ncbi:MAG: DUF1289 domain-containing protein [Pseudomonadota bacterium]
MDDDLFDYVAPARVLSPCINICRIQETTGWCVGCRRTLDEIGGWSMMDDAGRQAVLDQLPTRTTG